MTLIGTMKWGATDSCFEVQDGTKTRCYGFMAKGAVATTLSGACKQGDSCTVTGEFDNEKELLLSVTKAVTLAIDTKAAAVVPIPAVVPSAVTTPAQSFSGVAILAIVAVIVAALVGAIFIFWKRMRAKAVKPIQAASPPLTPSAAVKSPPSDITEIVQSASPSAPATLADTFQVVLKGIGANLAPSEARAKLAALMKASPEQTERLLAMPSYVVKRAISFDVASKYKCAIEAAGCVCVIELDSEPTLTLDVDLPTSQPSTAEFASRADAESWGQVPQAMPTMPSDGCEVKAIWNPNAIAWWSLLLSPAFGAYLQMLNWKALGKPEKASLARAWFYASLVVIAVLFLIADAFGEVKAVESVSRSIPLWYFVGWYYAEGRSQNKYVKAKFGSTYPRKPWTKVVLIAVVAYLCAVAAYVVLTEEQSRPTEAQASAPTNSQKQEGQTAVSAFCGDGHLKADFPPAWKSAFILADVNSPESFSKFICGMGDRGAKVRYLSGGMYSSEGFEVKSKSRTVQVYLEAQRVPGGDPKVPFLVPVSAKIDGTKMTITQENYRAFQAELIAAVLNQ